MMARLFPRDDACALTSLNHPAPRLLSDDHARLEDAHATLLEFKRVRNNRKGRERLIGYDRDPMAR